MVKASSVIFGTHRKIVKLSVSPVNDVHFLKRAETLGVYIEPQTKMTRSSRVMKSTRFVPILDSWNQREENCRPCKKPGKRSGSKKAKKRKWSGENPPLSISMSLQGDNIINAIVTPEIAESLMLKTTLRFLIKKKPHAGKILWSCEREYSYRKVFFNHWKARKHTLKQDQREELSPFQLAPELCKVKKSYIKYENKNAVKNKSGPSRREGKGWYRNIFWWPPSLDGEWKNWKEGNELSIASW